MRSRVAVASSSLVLMGAIGAAWLLTTFLPARVLASSTSATESSPEWTTTHSGEPSATSTPKAPAKPPQKNGTATSPQTSRKRPAAQAKGSGSAATQPSRKSDQAEKVAKPEPIGIQLEKLFRGIGADLEEFFVGTRTVDKDD